MMKKVLKNKYKSVSTIALFIVLATTQVQEVRAQFLPFNSTNPSSSGGGLQVRVSPSAPQPGQVVSLTVDSPSVDIHNTNVSWYQNNVLLQSGVGQDGFVFIAGDVGSVDTVRVVAQTFEEVLEKTISIRPAEVLLLWQANSYTPPFYQGKTLRAAEGDVTILAIPNLVENGVRVPDNQLVFTWEQDSTVLGSRSGLGRNTLSVAGSVLSRPIVISVEVETLSGSVKARRFVQIPATQPSVHLYENHPVLGVLFNNALTETTQIHTEETTVEAFPYFFSSRDRSGTLDYKWTLGSKTLDHTSDPRITVRRGESAGQTTLSIATRNPFSLLESAKKSLGVAF